MASRPCLRCCKLVPDSAAFCRRCGLALGAGPAAATAVAESPAAPAAPRRNRRGGPRFCFFPALMLVAAGLGVFSASSHRRHACPIQQLMHDLSDSQDLTDSPTDARSHPAETEDGTPAVTRARPPSINGWDSRSGLPGQTVTIHGYGFSDAQRVVFAAGPSARTRAARGDAHFEVIDDSTIEAVVPDLGRGPRDATIAVITPSGAAVTVPADDAPSSAGSGGDFVTVWQGETVTPSRGATLLVERGGCAVSASESVIFLRAGGGVERARTDCLIVRETGNPVTHDLALTPVIEVPELRTCRVDSLFRYAGRW